MTTFERNLDNLARVALHVGVNLQHDGRLLLMGPIEASALMHRIVAGAYDLGARSVHVQYVDSRMGLIRAQRARPETLAEGPQAYADMIHTMAARGDAYLRIDGDDPDLMSAADPERVATMVRATREVMRPVSDLVQRSFLPWTIVPYAVPAWARKVFPDLPEEEALSRLWDAIFAATRADRDDPVAAWDEHVQQLGTAATRLTEGAFEELHLRGPGTDLRLGLSVGHVWECGGRASGSNGVRSVHNVPTEEVFTAPHARRVHGTVRATKPLSYQGQLIDDFSLTFEDGAVVDFTAERGERVLQGLLDTDDGARRLGEVALVPHSSPISQSGLLFYNTLFDENAASHIALGRAYETTIARGIDRPLEELQSDGFNQSLTHVDFMIGSAELDVDGVRADGSTVPVMRGGEWAT
ncbi:aminopeptidase [soil metagenome]|nr:aminopeptidase [Trueperaceae bacterium]